MHGLSTDAAWRYLHRRFGVDRDELDRYRLVERSGDYWLVSAATDTGLDVKAQGIRCLRTLDAGFKPTTYALQLLDDHITENRVELSTDAFLTLLDGEEIDGAATGSGYVALVYRGEVFGCGWYSDGVVSSRIPKGRARHLSDFLREEKKKG